MRKRRRGDAPCVARYSPYEGKWGGGACDWEETIKGASLAGNYGYETRTEISGGYVIMSEGRSW